MKASFLLASSFLVAALCAGPSLAQKSGPKKAVTIVNKTDASIRVFLFVRGLRGQCDFPWHGPVEQVDVPQGGSRKGEIPNHCGGKSYPVQFEVQSAACQTLNPREVEVRGSQVTVNPPKRINQYPPHPCDIVQ